MRIMTATHKLVRRDNDGDYSHSEAATEVSFDLDEGESFGSAIDEISNMLVDANRSSIEAQRRSRATARTAAPRQVEAPREAPAQPAPQQQAQPTGELGEDAGALWKKTDKNGNPALSGKIHGQKVYIPNEKGTLIIKQPDQNWEEVGSLNDEGGRLVGTCEGQDIICVVNKNKKANMHPDYKVHLVKRAIHPLSDQPDRGFPSEDVPF